MKNYLNKIKKYSQELFCFFIIAYLILAFLELIAPNFILPYFNLNFLLAAGLISFFISL